ncbi:hypothetical protein JG687_00018376 [Phytophthora cactorum]|nr:hypothetical protein PC120_g13067 [Phytophthora cactorum]KAG3058149.1 hypothetical protein PC121_g14491 [Phytophthora cactorum]KAG3179155.1 hypothetical protein PC128_g16053 [Phytophthora cactorum]KAG4049281.1 hypothetical protein PC123_g15426 [Phytophthora cactorum]KAG6943560.1 hypothetical protein JG687_00018376 [Phytophthora cactorum]
MHIRSDFRSEIPFGKVEKKVIKQQDEGKQKQIEAGDDGEETCRGEAVGGL